MCLFKVIAILYTFYQILNFVWFFQFHKDFCAFSAPVPPEPASVHILQTSSTSITARWRITDNGYSPINKIVLNYKMTYGEWAEKEVRNVPASNVLSEIGMF